MSSSPKKHPHKELALHLLQGVAMAQMLRERSFLALAKGEDLGRKAVFVVISFAVVTNDPKSLWFPTIKACFF